MRYVGRFAPSPSGPLHFGSLLAAVGSYLQARQANGDWLLRIEDLDRPRVVPGAAENIIATLAALGFEWQGAIEYQSKRLSLYAEALELLRLSGCLYECSCSRAQITAATDETANEARYTGTCRTRSLPHTGPTALRFRASPGAVEFADRIQGKVSQDVDASVGDFVVRRRDGIFAYHLAVVVDDAAQGITEVVRGVDLLESTPRQILLQRTLGVATPHYAHLPLAVDRDGKKLSKSSQSMSIDANNAGQLLWRALEALRQEPPASLAHAPSPEIWSWAIGNWKLTPLTGLKRCLAPTPHAE